MLKYIGIFAIASCLCIVMQASPTSNCTTNTHGSELLIDLEEETCSCIDPVTLDLLMKFGSSEFQVTYQDMCTAYEKGFLNIEVTPLTSGAILYTLTFEGCAICALDTEL